MLSIGQKKAAVTASRDEMKTVVVTAALIIEQGKILVTQRNADSSHGFLWEFPGGKVKEGEEPRKALRRELIEELEVEVEVRVRLISYWRKKRIGVEWVWDKPWSKTEFKGMLKV